MASTAALLLKMALSAGLAYLTLRLSNNAAQRERRQGQLCAIRQVQVQRWRREKRVRQRRQKQEGRQLLTYAQYMREKRQFQFEQEGEGEEEEVGEAAEAGEAGKNNSEKEGMTTTGTEDYRECLSSNESVAASQNNQDINALTTKSDSNSSSFFNFSSLFRRLRPEPPSPTPSSNSRVPLPLPHFKPIRKHPPHPPTAKRHSE